MAMIKGLEWTFDTVASGYDKMRPGYVKELYQEIFDYCPIGEGSSVIEVGSGSGQATEPVLSTGCSLISVEYGERFAELLKDKFAKYPKFSVITGKFEDAELEENAYDLIFSATAFHWVPEGIGYPKVFRLLKNGGAFARFANRPDRDKKNPQLSDEIDSLYEEYYCKFHNRKQQKQLEFTENQAEEIVMIPGKYGFSDIKYSLFHRERVFSAKEYTALLGTYSDHIAIEENMRREFFSKIEEAINSYGGSITIYDTIDLELARKVV